MEFLDVVRRRKTTNGAFRPDPVSEEHQRLLMEVAGRAPSQLNSQPWRFVITDNPAVIEQVADISGSSMTTAMSNGTFFERYKPYFLFSAAEMAEQRSGMLFDKLPVPLRPFTRQVFTARGQKVMNQLRVPQTLGAENRKLVAGSPLLLAVMLDRAEYRPGQLSSFYSLFSMGAAMENVWLTTVEIGMGIHNEPGARRLSPIPPLHELIPQLIENLTSTSDPDRSFVPFKGRGDRVVRRRDVDEGERAEFGAVDRRRVAARRARPFPLAADQVERVPVGAERLRGGGAGLYPETGPRGGLGDLLHARAP